MREYHLTPRPNKKARNKTWFAWYIENGRRKYRSTKCSTKSDAIKTIEHWKKEDAENCSGNLRSLTKDFFVSGKCPYLQWRTLKPQTINEHKRNKKVITDKYGDRTPRSITAPEVEQWLEEDYKEKSASWKINLLNTFRIMLVELRRKNYIIQVPEFRRPQKTSTKADALSIEEIYKLFPGDEIDLALMWTRGKEKKDKKGKVIKRWLDPDDKAGLLFGIMFRVMLHAGMRPGEVRALQVSNLYPQFNGIHISQQIDSSGDLTFLKKGSAADRRERLVKVPASTMSLLTTWIERQEIEEGFIFLYNDGPVRIEYLEARFDEGLKNAKIKINNRKIVPYSLRYTYRSRVEGYLKQQQIMDAMGHRSDEMSLHYLHVHPDQFRAMEVEQERVEETWSNR